MERSKKITIVTHNGSFHSDDVFAVATLLFVIDADFEIIRTRDEAIIEEADYVVDVGGIHDPHKKRFDHHQVGGAGKRHNSIPYAAFGLVWKHYGESITKDVEISESIDEFLVTPLDAQDNGVEIVQPLFKDVYPYSLQNFIQAFAPTWKEKTVDIDTIFLEMVAFAKALLDREIIRQKMKKEARLFVEHSYYSAKDKRIIVLDDKYSFRDILTSFTEPLFVIYPDNDSQTWHVQAVPTSPREFEIRKAFPYEWGGKRDKELQKLSGVSDAVFCHNKLFIAVARSKKGALQLAEIAINE
ncbi:MYG1 family protein [Candidatus Parcubacteria bacterium]|nr:MYG1 family protein [Candidatus Parcubacteria bacterium]